ncbi:MAG: pilus assembly protein [Solirubrobacteraceae bacterium]|nr:pilus assembly protein [Solirubrobacteraceae bacterium]
MVARGTGHRRKLTVPMWSGRGGRAERSVVALRAEPGQASVEFVALIPIFVLAALAMGQGAVAGYTVWTASAAARIGARAEALGKDPKVAVRRELPGFLRTTAHVRAARPDGKYAGRILVTLQVPAILPGLDLGVVRGRSNFPSQAG